MLPVTTACIAAIVVGHVLRRLDVGDDVTEQLALVDELLLKVVPFQEHSSGHLFRDGHVENLLVTRSLVSVGPRTNVRLIETDRRASAARRPAAVVQLFDQIHAEARIEMERHLLVDCHVVRPKCLQILVVPHDKSIPEYV